MRRKPKLDSGYLFFLSSVTGIKERKIVPLKNADIEGINQLLGSLGFIRKNKWKKDLPSVSRKELMTLRFGLGCERKTVREIGEIFQVSGANVAEQVSRAVDSLRLPVNLKKLVGIALGVENSESQTLLHEIATEFSLDVNRLQLMAENHCVKNQIPKDSFFELLINKPATTPVIEHCILSVRTMNCLKNAKIKTISELAEKSEHEMLRVTNLGKICLLELKKVLAENGLEFRKHKRKSTRSLRLTQ
ncbi:MAG: DNA-directed RNA polymerase subunit alpha C-terminal domain-containing protein [Candidatus Moraniibacteriota bacterium]